jgi:hypothetical protein
LQSWGIRWERRGYCSTILFSNKLETAGFFLLDLFQVFQKVKTLLVVCNVWKVDSHHFN